MFYGCLDMKEECVFCKIAKKESGASIVFEDEKTMAFMDIRPVSDGHVLVIPKEHYQDIFDINEDLICQVHKTAKKIAVGVKRAVNSDGISIVQQNGRAAGQVIFHLHVHIIPRTEGQGRFHSRDVTNADRKNLDKIASRIKENI